jgi:transcriptional regulator of NAD metabolism
MEDFNFELGEEEKTERQKALTRLNDLAKLQAQYEEDVNNFMKELAAAQARLKEVSEKLIPEVMAEMELKETKTEDGIRVEIKESLRASIAQGDMEKQAQAFKWLEDNGHGHLIKREFKIEFGKSEEKWANQFEGQLKRRKKPLHAKRKQSVHHGTLAAFLTEQLKKGVEVPLGIFNGFLQTFAKVDVPKK